MGTFYQLGEQNFSITRCPVFLTFFTNDNFVSHSADVPIGSHISKTMMPWNSDNDVDGDTP